jgi:hypothetical protein
MSLQSISEAACPAHSQICIKIVIRNRVLHDSAICRSSELETGRRQSASGHLGPGLPEESLALIMKDGKVYENIFQSEI